MKLSEIVEKKNRLTAFKQRRVELDCFHGYLTRAKPPAKLEEGYKTGITLGPACHDVHHVELDYNVLMDMVLDQRRNLTTWIKTIEQELTDFGIELD